MEKSKPMADKVECSWKVHPYYKYIMEKPTSEC